MENTRRDRGDYAAAQSHFHETLARWRALGDKDAIARCLHNLANFVRGRGQYACARAVLEEAGLIFEELGDKSGAAWCLNQLGDIAREEGALAAARELYQNAFWHSAKSTTAGASSGHSPISLRSLATSETLRPLMRPVGRRFRFS